MNKENVATTPTFTRKRAKSFSTPPTAQRPAKSARGILKGNQIDDAHTIAFMPIHSPSKQQTASAEKRRKSISRRVSFASHAAIRVFEQPGEASPQETPPRRSGRLSPAKSPIPRPDPALNFPSKKPKTPIDEASRDSGDELTMDLTGIVPQGSSIAQSQGPIIGANAADPDSESDEDADDDENEDDTAAMDLTDVIPANATSKAPAAGTPRRSMLPIRASSPSKSPKSLNAQGHDHAHAHNAR